MQLQRDHFRDGVAVTVTTFANVDQESPLEEDCDGVIKIEDIEGIELPTQIKIELPDDSYIEVFSDEKVTTDEFPVTFNCNFKPKDSNQNNVSATIEIDGIKENKNIKIPLRPAHIINSAGKILSNGLSNDLWNDIIPYNRRKDLTGGGYRKDLRNHVDFRSYYQILNSIYGFEDVRQDITEDIVNSFEKHVVSEGAKYHPTSNEDFEEMLDFYSGLDNLPTFDKNQINEFKGYINENFAKQAVWSGDFDTAKDYLSTAINHFEEADRSEIKRPAVIKKSAIKGLIEESKGEFKKAKRHYQEAATNLHSEDKHIYHIWAQLAGVKHDLAIGDYETAISNYKSISGGDLKYSLVDLTKLKVLVELLEDLENDELSDGSTIFSKAEMPGTPEKLSDFEITRDLIVQYETDYSSAYSVLLSKQQLKKLGHDSIDSESLQDAIVDGITPQGNENSPSKSENNSSNNEMGTPERERSSGLDKTRERSKDRTYDALEENNDETISYESHVDNIQKGDYQHEEALDILEDHLRNLGFRGGETNRSDLIVTDRENILLVEAKHISSENETKQTRKAVGQLLEYRYRDVLQDDDFKDMNLSLWLLLTQSPSDSFKPILESYQEMGIYTLWTTDEEITGLRKSIDKLKNIGSESATVS